MTKTKWPNGQGPKGQIDLRSGARGAAPRALVGGFTLIELLVVISVISLLVSITLPALGHARETSRRAVCLANVQSIGHGMQMYMDGAGKGVLPYVNPLHGTSTNPNDPSLLDLLSEYLTAEVPRKENPGDPNSLYISSGTYKCPSDMGATGGNGGQPSWATTGTSYEYVPGVFMLLAESLFVKRPAFGVTKAIEKAHEKHIDWPIVADYGDWHLGRSQLPRKNACYMPDWHTDWAVNIDDQNILVEFITDIRRFGGQ